MTLRTLALILILAFALPFASPVHPTKAQTNTLHNARSAVIPAPHEVLGFTPGDDRKLASWNQILTYFDKLDQASDRVKFEALGKSTMDKPFVMVTISAPENLARLDQYRTIQEILADPRKIDFMFKALKSPADLRRFGIPDFGPRPTYGIGKSPDEFAKHIIERGKTIVLITCGIHSTEVGSTLSSMLIAHRLASSNEPEIQEILKNTIVLLVPSLNPDGVDIVKNWYDKTLGTPYEGTDPPELYHKYVGHDNNRDWYAFTQVETQITVDKIHNVWHPQIVHDIHQQGQFASRLFLPPYMPPVEPNVPKQIVAGYTELGSWIASEMRKAGFQGITTGTTYDAWTPARAYSHYHGGVRILSETASARIATPTTLKFEQLRSREGYDPQKESDKFGPVWRGGEWDLRDITNYMTTGAFKLLQHAAQNREQWLRRFYEIGKEAVRPRKKGELFGFIVPRVEQRGPRADNREALLDILHQGGVAVIDTQPFTFEGSKFPKGTAIIRMDQPYASFAKALLERQTYPDLRDKDGHPVAPYDVTAHTLPLLMDVPVIAANSPIVYKSYSDNSGGNGVGGCGYKPSHGLYRSYIPSMDEGWTRWILEQRRERGCFTYKQITNEDIKAGGIGKLDSIIIPDQAPRTILNGHLAGVMPPEYTGGIGEEGVKALREFVEQGGTVVFLNRASEFAIEQFKLPVKNVVAGLPRTDFYVPGSILRIELDTSHRIASQMPKESIAWAEDSPVFEIPTFSSGPFNVRVIAWYPKDKEPLLSGWLLGGDRIKGKAALVEVTLGKGRMILFGFRPQYRAQSLATFPLFFNSIRMK